MSATSDDLLTRRLDALSAPLGDSLLDLIEVIDEFTGEALDATVTLAKSFDAGLPSPPGGKPEVFALAPDDDKPASRPMAWVADTTSPPAGEVIDPDVDYLDDEVFAPKPSKTGGKPTLPPMTPDLMVGGPQPPPASSPSPAPTPPPASPSRKGQWVPPAPTGGVPPQIVNAVSSTTATPQSPPGGPSPIPFLDGEAPIPLASPSMPAPTPYNVLPPSSPASGDAGGPGGGGILGVISRALDPLLKVVTEIRDMVAGSRGQAQPPPGGRSPAPALSPTEGLAKTVGGAMGGPGGDLLGGAASAISSALGPIASAANAAVNSLMGVVSASAKYVESLSPSATMMLTAAFRDLHAVIGTALLPIVNTATAFIRDFADRLLPITSQLQGVFGEVGKLFLSAMTPIMDLGSRLAEALVPVVKMGVELAGVLAEVTKPFLILNDVLINVAMAGFKVLVATFQPLLDVMKSLAPLFTIVSDAMQVFSLTVQAVGETIAGFVKSLIPSLDFRNITASLANGFRELLKAAVLAAAGLAKLMGADSFVNNLAKAFGGGEKGSSNGLAAIQSPQFQGFAELGRSTALNSLRAGPGGPSASPDEVWKKGIAEDLKKIAEGKDNPMSNAVKDLRDAVLSKLDDLVEATKGVVWDKPTQGARKAFHGLTFGLFESNETLERG